MLKLISHAESAPPNRKIFQNGTANTETAVKFQRGGPKFSSPLADSGWLQARVSSVKTWTSSNCLRGASGSLDAVPNGSNLDQRPPTTSSDGDESHRWREGTTAPRDAEIAQLEVLLVALEFSTREVDVPESGGLAFRIMVV